MSNFRGAFQRYFRSEKLKYIWFFSLLFVPLQYDNEI